MSTQPEVLIRADELEAIGAESSLARAMAAHSLRLLYAENQKLHEVNAELVEALQAVMDSGEMSLQLIYESREAADKAKAAFAKATGEQP